MNGAELLLGKAAIARASQPALFFGREPVTHADLAANVRRAAGAFAALGVRPGERVMLLMRDTPEFAAAWLGTVRAGAVAVALNSKLSEAEYHHVLADSAARLVLVEDVFARARPDLTAELSRAGRVVIAGEAIGGAPAWRAALAAAPEGAAFDAGPESPAFMLYSSGTTGMPKGIVHAHKAFRHLGGAFRAFGLDAQDTVLCTSRLFFAYGLEHGLLAPLAQGLTSIVFPDWPDTDTVIELAAAHRPSALFAVPTVYRRLLAQPADRLDPFRRMRRFVAAGERLSPQLVHQWKEAVGGELLNLYGMSETFCACIVTPPETSDGTRTGRVLPGVAARLAQPGGAEPAPGEPGVLWLRHPAQASEYANLPSQTRAQFQDGWFCSLDFFMRDAEGFYIHQGRADELVKIAGQWVQPGELEEAATLANGVEEAACVPVRDDDGLERLALFVASRADPEEVLRAAAAACEGHLPRYKRPKWIRAVAELPRTATGKVQRFKLREILERELGGRD